MREIKFRAWDKGNNEMFIPHSIEFGENRVLKSATTLVYFKNVELMQYTGLKDIHGIMIYEGDILTDQETGEFYKVIFEECGFKAEYKEYLFDLIKVAHFCEVIGNIYENPELLGDDEL